MVTYHLRLSKTCRLINQCQNTTTVTNLAENACMVLIQVRPPFQQKARVLDIQSCCQLRNVMQETQGHGGRMVLGQLVCIRGVGVLSCALKCMTIVLQMRDNSAACPNGCQKVCIGQYNTQKPACLKTRCSKWFVTRGCRTSS